MMDDSKKGPSLTVVADNSSASLDEQRAQRELERSEARASDSIRRLATNLLRIIAGAGEPWSLIRDIDEARVACLDYLTAETKAGFPAKLLTRDFDLDHLFLPPQAEAEPVTEEDWRQWAQPKDPYDEYYERRAHIKLALRRAVLRQVASVLSSGERREPHLKAHGGNLDDLIEDVIKAERQFERQRLQPPRQPNPQRQAIAEQKIAEVRREKRALQLRLLAKHHIAGLRAVESGAVDRTDAFTLEVLGGMKLLVRPKGSKGGKLAWQLTDEGRSALELHSNPSAET